MSFYRHALCSWDKTNPMPFANKNYQADTEFYIHAWSEAGYPRGELKDKKRRWTGSSREDGQVKRVWKHPTVKPLGLMKKIITNVAGRVILDPFCGTGTTGVAALQDGRYFIGIEKREKYFDIAAHRLQTALTEKEEPCTP